MEQERALVWQAGCSALESGRGESEAGEGDQCGGRSDGGSALQMWFFMEHTVHLQHMARVAVVDRVAGVPRERGAVLDSMRGGRRA